MFKNRFFSFVLAFFASQIVVAQTGFSERWEDFYSYNNVKAFTAVDGKIFAAADNAVFIYNEADGSIEKFSSVNGLSGKTTSGIHFNPVTGKFIVGYETGLIEIIDEKRNITYAGDIERLDISGKKSINHIAEDGSKIYLSTPFGIVVYNLENLQFGDTYFIGSGSKAVFVNQTTVYNGRIYAATAEGIFSADANDPNLIDHNSWKKPEGNFTGNFTAISIFNGRLYASRGVELLEINAPGNIVTVRTFPEQVKNLKASSDYLTVSLSRSARVLDTSLNQIALHGNTAEYPFTLHTAFAEKGAVFMATSAFGILKSPLGSNDYVEIHPEGPSSNQVFSITAQNGHLWVVYGGYDGAFTPLGNRKGFSHFYSEDQKWVNVRYTNDFPAPDLVHVTIDPENENKAYISSWGRGILVVENDQPVVLWNETNSGLESLEGYYTIRINGSAFDGQGNFWTTNSWVANKLKKRAPNGNWKSVDLSALQTNPAMGLTELIVDKTNNIWIGSRRNGAYVYNETGERKKVLIAQASKGNLPDPKVSSIVSDRNNRIWIGTQKGLVVYNNPGGLFEQDIYDANPVIIEDDGIPKKLLGDQAVNTIAVDGADNKWFGTDTGGVLHTNSSGSETIYNFNKDNSPLPSNRIFKISIDHSTGKVFFATDKGIVAFNSNVAPYGETLTEVYAYPNPVTSGHETVTIDGRNGNHLPRGTNVKILDTAGRLVFETNVVENQESSGGKVVWNKTNLAGRKVASGVYIVLLTSPDKSETASAKIAIIN